jgi:hypothetical protein
VTLTEKQFEKSWEIYSAFTRCSQHLETIAGNTININGEPALIIYPDVLKSVSKVINKSLEELRSLFASINCKADDE